MSQKVRPFLLFSGQAEEAMNYYVSLLPAAQILAVTRYGKDEPGAQGSIKNALVCIGGHTLLCTDSIVQHNFTFTSALSLQVRCDSQEEIRRLATALSEGGSVFMPLGDYGFSQQFAWVSDCFGVSWQLNLE